MSSGVRRSFLLALSVAAACAAPWLGGACDGGDGGGSSHTSTASGDLHDSGSHDAGADAVEDGASPGKDPVWAPIAATPAGCAVERVTNPAEVRAFSWAPCEGTPVCEQVVFTPAFDGVSPTANSSVREGGGVTRLALSFYDATKYYTIFVDQDGWLIDGYRVERGGAAHCLIGSGAWWASRYGVVVITADPDPSKVKVGGLLHTFGAAGPPLSFDVTPTPTGVGPGAQAMGSDRWMWRYYPDKLLSMRTTDGAGAATVAGPADPTILALGNPVSVGPSFLFSEVELPEGGALRGFIASSNGVDPPTPYLASTDGSFYDFPAFADTHVAWLRGIGIVNVNKYQAVEVWASPYSEDPGALAPYKVDDYPATSMSYTIGGHGRLAAPSTVDAPVHGESYVWDLATKTRTSVVLPGGRRYYGYLGLTSKHLWILGAPQDDSLPPDLLARFSLE
jgi:hypothetical protein